MIPKKLELRNFLSYGPEAQIIDFEPYQLICLSGKNGHGKSALLDAITWAVWGQARKVARTSKADEGLLRLGQTMMFVRLDFECNGTLYRVRREFNQSHGKSHAQLDFAILNNGRVVSLTDKTIRATQEKIEQTIGIDYDSYINSAFLRQGQANEFSKKSAKERKQIVASILGLQKFDELKKLAQEKVRTLTNEKDSFSKVQERIEIELKTEQELASNVTTVNKKLKDLTTQSKKIAAEQEALKKDRASCATQEQELKLLRFQQEHLQKNLRDGITKLQNIRAQWRTVHAHKIAAGDQKALKNKQASLSKQVAKFAQLQQKRLALKEDYLQTKETEQKILAAVLQQHKTHLSAQHVTHAQVTTQQQAFTNKLTELQTAHKQITQELETTNNVLNELQKNQRDSCAQTLSDLEKLYEKRSRHYQRFIQQGTQVSEHIQQLSAEKNSCASNTPHCPLCLQKMSAQVSQHVHHTLDQKLSWLTHRRDRLRRLVSNLKDVLVAQRNELQTLRKNKETAHVAHAQYEATVTAQKTLQKKLLEIEQQKNQTIATQNELKKQELSTAQAIEKLQKQEQQIILNSAELKPITTKLEHITKTAQALGYDAQLHQAAQKELTEVEQQLQRFEKLDKELALQENRAQNVFALCGELKKAKQESRSLETKLKTYEQVQKKLDDLAKTEQQLTAQLKEIDVQRSSLLQEQGRLLNQKELLKKRKKEFTQHAKEIEKLTTHIGEYQDLATAFSKDGIQALLIEQAIPEIEQEANTLLSKLTDNQAQLMIESLRDLKRGGTKETLDIKISDAMGIRPYEMFSGGEAFRIDFALRIAISKLLARRAGTSLQTLIIDEGFGSQDEEGLSRIMDAIHKIQDDFVKVIIVSHLTSLKDQFPVHFVVNKETNGTVITVFEHG